jgi:hypothetical protein
MCTHALVEARTHARTPAPTRVRARKNSHTHEQTNKPGAKTDLVGGFTVSGSGHETRPPLSNSLSIQAGISSGITPARENQG